MCKDNEDHWIDCFTGEHADEEEEADHEPHPACSFPYEDEEGEMQDDCIEVEGGVSVCKDAEDHWILCQTGEHVFKGELGLGGSLLSSRLFGQCYRSSCLVPAQADSHVSFLSCMKVKQVYDRATAGRCGQKGALLSA